MNYLPIQDLASISLRERPVIYPLDAKTEGKKKLVLFSEIGRVKIILSFTRLRCRMCIRIYIFNFKKKQKENKTKQEDQKQKKLNKKMEYLWNI